MNPPTTAACGTAGAACTTCAPSQVCSAGACVCDRTTCTGCCNAGGLCVPATAQACGSQGGACAACAAGLTCDATGKCACTPASCPGGCCQANGTCVAYAAQSATTCGAAGRRVRRVRDWPGVRRGRQLRLQPDVVPERVLRFAGPLRGAVGAIDRGVRRGRQRLRHLRERPDLQQRRLQLRQHELRRLLREWRLHDRVRRRVRRERRTVRRVRREPGVQRAGRVRLQRRLVSQRLLRRERQCRTSANATCGTGGNACTACATGQTCGNGACVCNAASCPSGCCDSSGQCRTSAAGTCGTGGAACKACATGQACAGGACVCNATSCPSGCCDSSGMCRTSSAGTCGTGGAACAACATGQTCAGGMCVCNASSCAGGCCDANRQCHSPPSSATCGTNGGTCMACASGTACSSGGACVCNATSCPNGCCNGTTCVAYASQSNGQCGMAGAACAACAASQRCDNSAGRCVAAGMDGGMDGGAGCTWGGGPGTSNGELTCYWFSQGTATGGGCPSYKTYCGYCGTQSGSGSGTCPSAIMNTVPNTATPYFVAFPSGSFAQGRYCGMCVNVSWMGKSIIATVVDACATCPSAQHIDLDLSAAVALGIGQGSTTGHPTSGVTWRRSPARRREDLASTTRLRRPDLLPERRVPGRVRRRRRSHRNAGVRLLGLRPGGGGTTGHADRHARPRHHRHIPGASGGNVGAQFPMVCQ